MRNTNCSGVIEKKASKILLKIKQKKKNYNKVFVMFYEVSLPGTLPYFSDRWYSFLSFCDCREKKPLSHYHKQANVASSTTMV